MRTWALRVIALLMLPGLASAASFIPLGYVQTTDYAGSASGISGDGLVVAGFSGGAVQPGSPYRWTAETGKVVLQPAWGSIEPRGVSGDGSVIVGRSSGLAFRWTAATGSVSLGDFPGGYASSAAWATSANGSVVVGSGSYDYGYNQAFRWTDEAGMVGLGFLADGSNSEAHGVSGDGSVVVGGSTSSSNNWQTFRWTAETGMVGLGYLPGDATSVALGVSQDGSVIVGQSSPAGSPYIGTQAFRWSAEGGMVGLGYLPGGNYSSARGVSGDGSVVVGKSASGAFVWTETTSMQTLFDVLVAGGATGLAGWTLSEATGISADGQWVVGNGYNPLGQPDAFVANIAPVPLPAAAWLFGSALGLMGVLRRRQDA